MNINLILIEIVVYYHQVNKKLYKNKLMETNLFSSSLDFLKNNIYIVLFVIVFIIFIIYFVIYIKNRKLPIKNIIPNRNMTLQQQLNNVITQRNILQQQLKNITNQNTLLRTQLTRLQNQPRSQIQPRSQPQPQTQPRPQPQPQPQQQNKNLVRFVRIDRNPKINQPLMLNINEILILDEKKKLIRDNLKPSLYPQYGNPKQFGPQYLINNVLTSRSGNNWMLPHTTSHMDAFMEIDLSRSRNISMIGVYNRDDCCKDRITRARLVLLDENRKVLASLPFNGIKNIYAFRFENGVLSYSK